MLYRMNAVRPELIFFKERLMMVISACRFRVAAKGHSLDGLEVFGMRVLLLTYNLIGGVRKDSSAL